MRGGLPICWYRLHGQAGLPPLPPQRAAAAPQSSNISAAFTGSGACIKLKRPARPTCCSLPFRLHCLVHTLHLVLHLRDLPTMCAMSFFTHDAVSRFFARTAELLALIGAVVGFAGGTSARSAKADPALQGTLLPLVRHPGAQCDCVLVVGTLQVLLGFLLPSFALLVWERASRAAFVAARRQQHWSQADLHQHLFYDWLPPWVAFVSAQPLLISLVWHVVVLAAFQAGVC